MAIRPESLYGDMSADQFRQHGHAMVEWIARYLDRIEQYPVLARVAPGDIKNALPASAPEKAEPFEAVMADVDRVHARHDSLNHPGFFAYFAITASALACWPTSCHPRSTSRRCCGAPRQRPPS